MREDDPHGSGNHMHEATSHESNARTSTDSTPIPQEDRRGQPRFLLSLSISMRGENNFYTGLSENISEAGVFIATAHVLAIGTPVMLSFTLPGSDDPISVVGTVRWLRGPNATAKAEDVFGQQRDAAVKPGIGVQFSAVSEESHYRIRAFMQRRSPDFYD